MKNFISKLVVITLLSGAAIFAVFISFQKTNQNSQAEVLIMALPRSERTANNSQEVLENLMLIPRSLTFYSYLVKENKDIEDGAAGFPDAQRKAYWNEKIQAERVGQSGAIKFKVSDQNQWQSEIIAYQLAKDVIAVAGKYYDPKNDLEIRLIDGPVVQTSVNRNISRLIPISLFTGFIFGLFSLFIFSFFSKLIQARKKSITENSFSQETGLPANLDLDSGFDGRDFSYEFDKERAEEKNIETGSKKENEIKLEDAADLDGPVFDNAEELAQSMEKEITSDKKADAPDNLPGSEESLPNIFKSGNRKKEEEKEIKTIQTGIKEASPEEVKERLKRLLKGKF